MKTQRIAVVGIDGAGKSTIIRRLMEVAPHDQLAIIHCPSYHQHPDAPLGGLSRAVEAYSQAADKLGSFELKAAALYLQMTLYGPVERAMCDAFAPRYLLCERHPIIDTLAYGPFYKRMVSKEVDPAQVEAQLAAELERRVSNALPAVRAWHEREAHRLGLSASFWNLAHDVCAQLERPLTELIAELSRRYRTSLPELIILLDVSAEEAAARVRARSHGGESEMHETAPYLDALRQSYTTSLDVLGKAYPGLRIRRITTEGRNVSTCLDELVAEAQDLVSD